jgi:histidine triad (HIT) family protein
MADGCVFCRIISGDIPAKVAGENEAAVAFFDSAPQAPVHVLIVPRSHITGLREISTLPETTVHQMLMLANEIASSTGIIESGYRLLTNNGPDSGQSVFHLHWHLLGGRALTAGFA